MTKARNTYVRCLFVWNAPVPGSRFPIDHRCGLEAHEKGAHACPCGTIAENLGTCTMCEEQLATTVWFAPVCADCAAGLDVLDANLAAEEANDPTLAELGRTVDMKWQDGEVVGSITAVRQSGDGIVVEGTLDRAKISADLDRALWGDPEPPPAWVGVIASALERGPEQGDWPWHDHCEGMGGYIAGSLKQGGYVVLDRQLVEDVKLFMAECRIHSLHPEDPGLWRPDMRDAYRRLEGVLP